MIKDNQKHLNRMQVILDGCVVAISYIIAYYMRFYSRFADPNDVKVAYSAEVYFKALYFIVPCYLFAYNFVNLYASRRTSHGRSDFYKIVKGNLIGLPGFIVSLYMIQVSDFSRGMLFIFFGVNIFLCTFGRLVIRFILQYFREKGYNLKHVLLVGYSRSAESYIRRIEDNPQWGYVITGILDNRVPVGTAYHKVKVIGKINQLQEFIEQNEYDEITITLALDHYDSLEKLVSISEKSGIHTKFIPDYSSLFPSNPYTEDVEGLPVINIRYVPLTDTWNKLIKRIVDIIGSLLCIIIFSPAMIFAAIAVGISTDDSIIYKQERIGLNGKPFKMYKFRTMISQNVKDEAKAWTIKNDPRVTPVGRFLRKTSIDEMPQFFNVLMGSMSLVGPRPERPSYVEKFKEQIPRYMVKHQVRPGITGWAQINGFRGDTSIKQRIDYDIYYIENWTLGFDIEILFGTIFHGFVNKNAY